MSTFKPSKYFPSLRRAALAISLLATAALTACGGGSGGTDAPARPGCAAASAVSLAGAGNLLSITITNPTNTARFVQLQGMVRFDGLASGASGGASMLVLTDGQSPVHVASINAPVGGRAQGAQQISTSVYLQPGSQATWHLAHAPLPAPYGWASVQFTDIELCAD